MEQMFTEMLLLPLGKQAQYESGELLREGDTARLAVMATLEVPQTLVLRKGPDGKWVVSLTQSAKASSGREELGLLRGLDQPAPEECMTHLKQLALAVHMWAQDHDGALPSAKGWGSELQPYLGNVEVFRCPAAPELECGYSLNLEVAGKKLAAVPQPSQTVLFYESTLGRLNAADRGESEPHPGRHKGGSFRAYVDGHVEFQRPAKR
jgi:prepilin-type processing-associated H-X9-DG protein